MGREDDAVDAGALGTAKERSHVVGILERVEDEDERRLATLLRPREDVLEGRELAWLDDESDPLVTVEAGERGQRTALDFDDRDPQVRGVKDDLFQRGPAVRNDEQPPSRTPRDECLFNRAAAGDQLLARLERVRRRQRRRSRSRRSIVEGTAIGIAIASVGRAPLWISISVRIPVPIRVPVPWIRRARARRSVTLRRAGWAVIWARWPIATWRARRPVVWTRRPIAARRSGAVIRTRRPPRSLTGFAAIPPRTLLM